MIIAIQWALRFVLGGVFVYAGAVKIVDPAQFLVDIESYRLVPYTVAVATALYLPWLELLAGAALWVGRGYRGALVILLPLTVLFGILITSAWIRGLDISCGCFGVTDASETHYPWLLGRDLLILAGLGVLAAFEWTRRGGGRASGTGRSVAP